MNADYYNTDAKATLERCFALIRNKIDKRYIRVLSPYFKPAKLREIINSTRFDGETQLSKTAVLNLLNDDYRKEGDKS